jgi:hypothetical protein
VKVTESIKHSGLLQHTINDGRKKFIASKIVDGTKIFIRPVDSTNNHELAALKSGK